MKMEQQKQQSVPSTDKMEVEIENAVMKLQTAWEGISSCFQQTRSHKSWKVRKNIT